MSKIKELVAAGHALAKDLHCAESAALVRELATQLEVQFVRSTNMAVQLANAESKCRELAGLVAENADLKSLIEQHACSIAVCPNCSHEEPSETDDIVALYRSLKTPFTDAFLAEVRAHGVEMFAEMYACEAIKDGDVEGWKSKVSNAASEYAAQLRKGAAL